jgi:hypothetical protein
MTDRNSHSLCSLSRSHKTSRITVLFYCSRIYIPKYKTKVSEVNGSKHRLNLIWKCINRAVKTDAVSFSNLIFVSRLDATTWQILTTGMWYARTVWTRAVKWISATAQQLCSFWCGHNASPRSLPHDWNVCQPHMAKGTRPEMSPWFCGKWSRPFPLYSRADLPSQHHTGFMAQSCAGDSNKPAIESRRKEQIQFGKCLPLFTFESAIWKHKDWSNLRENYNLTFILNNTSSFTLRK